MMPPLTTVGSMPPASSSAATSVVVVVLPLVPAMATQERRRMISASISARRTSGRPERAGGIELDIAGLDGGGIDHRMRVLEIVGAVADGNGDAHGAQALDIGAFGNVRALHLVAEIVHDLGDAAHADAANADEMNGADIQRNAGGDFHARQRSSATRSASLARRRAWPGDGRLAARRASSSGSAKIPVSI